MAKKSAPPPLEAHGPATIDQLQGMLDASALGPHGNGAGGHTHVQIDHSPAKRDPDYKGTSVMVPNDWHSVSSYLRSIGDSHVGISIPITHPDGEQRWHRVSLSFPRVTGTTDTSVPRFDPSHATGGRVFSESSRLKDETGATVGGRVTDYALVGGRAIYKNRFEELEHKINRPTPPPVSTPTLPESVMTPATVALTEHFQEAQERRKAKNSDTQTIMEEAPGGEDLATPSIDTVKSLSAPFRLRANELSDAVREASPDAFAELVGITGQYEKAKKKRASLITDKTTAQETLEGANGRSQGTEWGTTQTHTFSPENAHPLDPASAPIRGFAAMAQGIISGGAHGLRMLKHAERLTGLTIQYDDVKDILTHPEGVDHAALTDRVHSLFKQSPTYAGLIGVMESGGNIEDTLRSMARAAGVPGVRNKGASKTPIPKVIDMAETTAEAVAGAKGGYTGGTIGVTPAAAENRPRVPDTHLPAVTAAGDTARARLLDHLHAGINGTEVTPTGGPATRYVRTIHQ